MNIHEMVYFQMSFNGLSSEPTAMEEYFNDGYHSDVTVRAALCFFVQIMDCFFFQIMNWIVNGLQITATTC